MTSCGWGSLSAALFTALLISLTSALRAQNAPAPGTANYITNADFASASGTSGAPNGWRNDAQGLVSSLSENGTHFVRLASQQPGQLVMISQEATIPLDVKGLEYSVRFRDSGVKFGANFQCDARSLFQFLDANGSPLNPSPGAVVFDSHAKDWTAATHRFLIPQGATRLKIMLCINKAASGTLDVAEVRLSPMSQADAEAIAMAPALMAKKKTDDEAEAQRMLTLPPKTVEIKVAGNKLVTADGKTVCLQGVNVPSLGWSAKGENLSQSMKVALVDWKANAVRLPVFDGFWFGTGKPPQSTSNDAEAYRKTVDDAVKMAAGQGAYLILDLHRFWMPEDRDVAFWKDAAARYKNNPAVLFDIFNETGSLTWEVWKNGGEVKGKPKKGETEVPVFHSVGMQALVNAVRGTGANNIIIAGGVGSAYDIMGVLQGFALEDKTGNGIMYAAHFYNWHKNWEKHFLPVAAKYPLFIGEFGADIKKMPFVPAKDQEDPYTWMPDALGMIQKYKLNWTAFSLHPKSTPILIENWDFTPTPFFGVFVKRALAGEPFTMNHER